eukprot:jgi/Phyca11/125440/e_gw1.58.219.1
MSSNRLRLTWSEKVAILEKAARSPTCSLSYIKPAKWAVEEFGLPTAPGNTTIDRILRSSTALLGCEATWSKVSASTIQDCRNRWFKSRIFNLP